MAVQQALASCGVRGELEELGTLSRG